ncbi:MAG: hypothetical protein Q8K96_15285 [Rubrivivax sp.]|nr:hypothetical protein [Rubrivivax sp.]
MPRHKLTALGVVGALIVALPLVQVLRYQNAELRAVLSERAAVDPVARAVAVQRGLLAHRDVAAQVLRGHQALEPERRLRQGEVDDRLASLSLALASGHWESALQEAKALYEDWSRLSRQVLARGVNATESDQAHRLLVEQTLQVIDLVAVALAPDGSGAPGGPASRAALALPSLTWRIAALTDGNPDADARAAASTALQAQLQRVERAQEARAAALTRRADAIELERSALLTALAALLGAAGVLVRRIGRALRQRQAGAAPAPAVDLPPHSQPLAPPQPAGHSEAGHLLRRLRERRDGSPAPAPARAEPSATLPPEE